MFFKGFLGFHPTPYKNQDVLFLRALEAEN